MASIMHLVTSSDIPLVSIAATALLCFIGIVTLRRALYTASKPRDESIRVAHNGCDDPDCIRCHSKSLRHIEAFRRNATLLRRLVKLEPELFEGMRNEIWTVVHEMERQASNESIKGVYNSVKRTVRSSIAPESTIDSIIPRSPQIGQAPTVFFLPNLEATPFHHTSCVDSCPCKRLWNTQPLDPKSPPIQTTGDIEMLQQNFNTIKSELDNVLSMNEAQFAPFDSAVYSSTGNNEHSPEWSSIYLFHQGLKQLACECFPKTTAIIETSCPNRMAGKCGLGSIYFSRLKCNTKVIEHYGPTNVRWRCHIPLHVPINNTESRLSVGVGANEEEVGWKEGVPILFDDSFLHSATYAGDDSAILENNDSRIVLIIDFWHPALSEGDRNAIGVLYPPGS
eukprot:scaffold55156_cov75-Cyclotella_meneghiniana.AAC.2